MEKVKIIIDSSSDLTFDEIEKYNVDVIPLTINIDGVEYNYRTISNDEYIVKMRTAESYSTSQPAIGKFIEAYEKWTNEGYQVIVLTLSSALSGTYNTAVTASSEFENVYVVDTKTTTRGMVFLLKECLRQLEENVDVSTIAANLREKAKNILTYVTIDKLDNLVKGGRLSKSQALIGGLLNIKVLTQLKETELVALDKVRGKKKLVHTLIKHIEEEKQSKTDRYKTYFTGKQPYPIVLNSEFSGYSLFRVDIDKKNRIEQFYQKGARLENLKAQNAFRVWASNGFVVKCVLIAGGLSKDLGVIGKPGEVVVKDFKWLKNDKTGEFYFVEMDVD